MSNWEWQDWAWLGVFVVICVGVVMIIGETEADRHRLKTACMADGHKEYECEAMLRNNVVSPVFIYTGGGR